MGEFHYVDIFATKGIEYLLVIFYLIVFVLFIRALFSPGSQRRQERGRKDHD